MLSNEEIHERVTYHSPSPAGVKRHARLSAAFETLMIECRDVCAPGRELALVFTKLEEAKMWASASVARNAETR